MVSRSLFKGLESMPFAFLHTVVFASFIWRNFSSEDYQQVFLMLVLALFKHVVLYFFEIFYRYHIPYFSCLDWYAGLYSHVVSNALARLPLLWWSHVFPSFFFCYVFAVALKKHLDFLLLLFSFLFLMLPRLKWFALLLCTAKTDIIGNIAHYFLSSSIQNVYFECLFSLN